MKIKVPHFLTRPRYLLLLSLSLFVNARSLAVELASIDEKPALEIGPVCVSQYLFDKYYRRFADGIRQQEHRAATARESRDWLDLFTAKQIVTAHAATLGYLDRPEVRSTVAQMERHMLTQPEGPFYQRLFSRQAVPSESELRSRYQGLFSFVDCIVVRFHNEKAAPSILGDDFDLCPVDEQSNRIRQRRGSEAMEIIESTMSWPFSPVSEIGDALIAAPTGQWVKHVEPGFGLYYLFKRNVTLNPAGNFEAEGKNFVAFATLVNNQIMQRRRHNQLLEPADLQLDGKLAAQLVAGCQKFIPTNDQIPAGAVKEVADKILFTYRLGFERATVTAEAFCAHFNALYIRHVPDSVTAIRALAENMVVEEIDLNAARAEGIDRTPQFVEDRKGFAGLVALELFERDVLIPELSLAPSEIQNYYAAHRAQFQHVSEVRGRLLKFDSIEQATAWQKRQPGPADSGPRELPPAIVPVSDQTLVVTLTTAIPGLEKIQPMLFQCPEGMMIGPVQSGSQYLCFLKQKNLGVESTSLAMAEAGIRHTLERRGLDERETALAAKLAESLTIKNHLDYARYETGTVALAETSRP